MTLLRLLSLTLFLLSLGCVTERDKKTFETITSTFESLKNSDSGNLQNLVEAQGIVLEYYSLFKTNSLTPENLDAISSKINNENGDILLNGLKGINSKLSGEGGEEKSESAKVEIPEEIGKPTLSKMKNKLKFVESDYNFNKKIIVPKQFEFNGTSIPEIAQEWLGNPFDKKMEVAGLVHDYLYSNMSKSLNYSKEAADIAFYDLLQKEGIPKSKAIVMYMGVAVGGYFFFQKD